MTTDPFHAVRRALTTTTPDDSASRLRLDPGRMDRTGIPEVVLAPHKTIDALVASLVGLVQRNGTAMASRLTPEQQCLLPARVPDTMQVTVDPETALAIVSEPGHVRPSTGGRVSVFSAGASDRPVAREAVTMVTELGCDVRLVEDVGVAGLHRLIQPLESVMAWEPDVIIVAAGMDGALPAVVAGLVDVPVIGLPVSVGYGYGGDGSGALMSMLQACAPGIAVVNIDNGIGAGSMAGLIANRAARARLGPAAS